MNPLPISETKTKVLIGIDPDTNKSGYALYDIRTKQLITLQTYDLVDLMNELSLADQIYDLTVHVEAGHLEKGTWHKGGNGMAKRVGANHEVARQIVKFLIKSEIKHKLIRPQGYSSWKHEQFCMTTKWDKKVKTNAETRVAGLLIYGY